MWASWMQWTLYIEPLKNHTHEVGGSSPSAPTLTTSQGVVFSPSLTGVRMLRDVSLGIRAQIDESPMTLLFVSCKIIKNSIWIEKAKIARFSFIIQPS